jgi:hypothetical protein
VEDEVEVRREHAIPQPGQLPLPKELNCLDIGEIPGSGAELLSMMGIADSESEIERGVGDGERKGGETAGLARIQVSVLCSSHH